MTDKSGKMAITTVEIYNKMGEEHTKNDKEISEEKLKVIQRKHNGHVSMWLKMGKTGENWHHEERFRESCINHSCCVSPLWLLLKDHKKVNPGELPRTRPVSGGNKSMGVHLSNLLSDYI